MNIAVQLEPLNGSPPAVRFRWDAVTDILAATLEVRTPLASPSPDLIP